MRRIWSVLFVLALLAINWAALHDILQREPNPWMEWAFVVGSVLLLITYLIRKVRQPA